MNFVSHRLDIHPISSRISASKVCTFKPLQTDARSTKKSTNLTPDKSIPVPQSARKFMTTLSSPGLPKSNASAQAITNSPKSTTHHSVKRDSISQHFMPSIPQITHVVPKTASRKRSSATPASGAKSVQLAARLATRKQLLDDLCSDLLCSVIEPIASLAVQQALRKRVVHSFAQQAQTTHWFVEHLSQSLQEVFLSELNASVAFEVASTSVLDRHNIKRQNRLLRSSFNKWVEGCRSHRPSPSKRHRCTSDALTNYEVSQQVHDTVRNLALY